MSIIKEIKVDFSASGNEGTLRIGEAAPVVPFRASSNLKGNLNTAYNYLKYPPSWFNKEGFDGIVPLEYSELKVNRDSGSIELTVDKGMPWQSSYSGILEMSEAFKLFGVNSPKSYTTFELADLIKMNRSFLETSDKAMALVSQLRNFKAKVDKELEQSDDSRGNKRVLMSQIVDSNIPEAFALMMPIFKGGVLETFDVEININAQDFSCTLISPEVNDYINENKNDLIDEQLALIFELFPNLKVFEI